MQTGMTRRALLTHPVRAIRENMEFAGTWLSRAAARKSEAFAREAARETADGTTRAPTVRGIGLREARANIRRNEHDEH